MTARGRPRRQSGWGQGACAGDYDNDGHEDLFVTYYGQNRLYHNRGDGTFEDVTAQGGPARQRATRWGTGCAFLDYDRDGKLDLFVANYIDLDLATAPTPGHAASAATRACRWPAVRPGFTGGKNVALPQSRATARSRTSRRSPGITKASGDLRPRA